MKLLPALAALFAAFMGLFTPDKPQIKEPPQMAQIVRTTENDYDKMWKKIESLEQKGMTKDALKLAEEILAKAKSENNDNQQVKSILHIMKYKNVVQENSDSLQMLFINEQIAAAKFPVKNILRSFKASMFEQYYNAHRWEIIGRTKVEGQVGNELDFKTYDPTRFMEAVQTNYLASLENASELQKESVGNYLEILVHDKNSESAKYQPTLYDILANRALDFFKSTEYDITRPADAFSLSITQGFAPAKEFITFQFSEKDNLSRDLHTTQIYQNLLSYHLKSGNTGALIMADLSRLTWAKDRVVITDGKNRNTAYIETLEALAKQYDSNEDAAEIYAIIASSYQQNNNKIKAMQICEATIQKYPNARGTKLCKDIKNQLLAKSLDMEVEDMNVPNKPIRARLAYQNLTKVYFRLIAKTKTLDDKIANKYNQERAKILAGEPALKTWEQTLPEAKDYLNHSTEVKIPEMQIGDYYLLCSDNSSFSVNHAALNYVDYYVHSVAHYQLRAQEGRYIFFTDRQSGEALPNLTVTEFQYDYNKQKEVTLGTFTTDKLGRILLTDTKDGSYRNTVFEIQRGTEKYRTQYIYRYPEYAERVETNYELHIFTDRKIYRPGQTVYFKAIFLSKIGEQVQLEKNKTLNIRFLDANNQEVTKQTLTTNNYGTISGTFTAPSTGLTGYMRLENEHGSADFNVEEYKRPKFDVSFKDIEGAFQLNDNITVKGSAMGFAGNAVDGAEVKYRVVRNVNYPFWGYYRWWQPLPYSPEIEIVNGTTKTDAEGNFTVEFKAIPDLTANKEDKPEFSYTVYADVVDITGETHSDSKSVSVGYIGLRADIALPAIVFTNRAEKDSISLNTTNLNGTFEPAKGKLTIHRLTTPSQIYRHRRWEKTDMYSLTEAEYHTAFPNDVWKNEDDYHSWAKAEKVMDFDFNTEKDKKINLLALKSAKIGKYVAELITQDKSGNEVKAMEYFTVNEEGNTNPIQPAVFEANFSKTTAEPGETITLTLVTSEPVVYLNYFLNMGDKKLDEQNITLRKGEPKVISIPIKEEHRGGLGILIASVAHNQFWSNNYTLNVPWTNKQLKIEWLTFRNKLLPGAKEEWRVKISGPKGEKVAAEMLAAMYDASLDEFRANDWYFDVFPTRYNTYYWEAGQYFSTRSGSLLSDDWNNYKNEYQGINYDRLNEFGFYFGEGEYMSVTIQSTGHGRPRLFKSMVLNEISNKAYDSAGAPPPPPTAAPVVSMSASSKDSGGGIGNTQKTIKDLTSDGDGDSVPDLFDKDPETPEKQKSPKKEVQVRKNLQETAFFFPTLMTNEAGEVIMSFTMPEALTKWKFMSLAHTQDLQIGQLTDKVVTQKELMVMPNTPRFLRVSDKVALGCKVVNLGDKARAGVIELKLTDALTGKDVTNEFKNYNWQQKFFAEKGQSQAITWELEIPETSQAIIYQMIAESENVGDGEENALPIVPNKMLVTETLPLWVNAGKSKTFNFNNLLNSAKSNTLQHQNFSLEFTSNPAWYAVQSLPYLMEYPHECTEQIFSRYYANTLASHIANSNPKIKQVFESWKNQPIGGTGKQGLLSNLETNQELKYALLSETPWVLDAQDETQRKKRIAVLFDLNKMASEQEKAEKTLAERQYENGGFSWFPGMKDSRYITQLIALGYGHLNKMKVTTNEEMRNAMNKAIPYLDKEIDKDYEDLKRYKADMQADNLGYDQIQYLYMRSFYLNIENSQTTAYNYYFNQAKKYWNNKSMYMKGMIALALSRGNEQKLAKEIIESLRQNAVHNEEMGMYWKQNEGYYWYDAPIERQALMIEAFGEVDNDQNSVEEMKIWLLKNKQTNDWKTTRATVDACNALLMSGGVDMLANSELAQIVVGGKKINPNERPDAKVEAGTGYFKTSWAGAEVKSDFGKIEVKNPNKSGTAWGGAYWQYFEQLDKIQYAATPIAIQKQLFIETPSASGPVLTAISDGNKIKQGDKIIVRVEIRVDRPMEYVHLKDMRAAGFEPINVLSQYKYQGGLGYYESTKDLATHFFIDYLPKGTYVFEYPLRATHKGNFSNGITTMQCMYAPEFSTHSKGIRVTIE